jgi:hypothetical protein
VCIVRVFPNSRRSNCQYPQVCGTLSPAELAHEHSSWRLCLPIALDALQQVQMIPQLRSTARKRAQLGIDRRLYASAGQALDVVLADRLHLSRG